MIYYGRIHDYLYFDEPWDYNGTHYQAGYYDENGNRYDSVVMKNEKGDSTVTITCQYCGSTAKIDWKEGDLPSCTHCGAPLELSGIQTDTISSSEAYAGQSRQETGTSAQASAGAGKKKRNRTVLLFVLAVLAGLGIRSAMRSETTHTLQPAGDTQTAYTQTADSDTQIFGTTVYLADSGSGTYTLASKDSYTKVLTWDTETESYYDSATGAYLWYNTDVTPPLWQYWFEGVSSYYESGWMEYEDGAWYIETGDGEWERYTGNTSGLWHIENRFDS